jgi:hypothetical protein
VKRLSVALAAFVILVLLSACGGDDGGDKTVSPAEWADNICTSLSSWKSSVTDVGDSLKGSDLSQDELQNASDDVSDATETLVGDLKDAGRPETESGQQAQDDVNQLSDEYQKDIGEIERSVDSASDGTGIVQAAGQVTATLGKMATQLSSAYTELQQLDGGAEIKNAFAQSDACNDLRGS